MARRGTGPAVPIGVNGMARTGTAPGRQALARARQDRRALVVMTIAHGIQHFYVAGLAVTYPFVVAQFHASYAVLGLWLSAAGLLGGLLQAAAGLLRRASARAVLTAQDLAMGGTALLGAAAPGFGAFGSARILGAAVSWPQHPVGSAYLSDRFPQRRATALSWHTAGGSLGTVAVPVLMSAAIAAAGWRWALVALGAALCAGALLVRAALPPERTEAAQAGERPAERAGLRQLLRRRQVAAVLAAGTIAAGGRGLGTLSTYIPAYLRSGLHLSTLTVGTLFTLIMAASIAGPVAGGLLADRFGRTRTLTVTYVAAAIAVAAFGYAGRSLWVLAVLGVCVGVLAYAESPLLQAVFSDLTGDGAARAAFGAFFAISYGIGSAWVAVIGWIISAAGFPAAFAAMAASFAAAALIIAFAVRGEAPSPPKTTAEDPA
ncbi:MAG TPA: MFS transporter [Streptosporangiaceae bacterium]|nr:MFS transporter [Streptosporangiaceae bacterium]